jgi:nucleotide-binding universal stress UspA family protein
MIKIKEILLPTDLSEYAGHALEYAQELAKTYKSRLHLVHVVDTHWIGPANAAEFPGQVSNYMQEFRNSGAEGLQRMEGELTDIPIETSVIVGVPHVEIVRYARDNNIDIIVLATHGRRGLAHALIGSVAEKIVQMAPCPVLTVKHPEHEFVVP